MHRYAVELNTLRCHVLRLATAHIIRPIHALISHLLSEQRAATAASGGGGGTSQRQSGTESKPRPHSDPMSEDVPEEAVEAMIAPEAVTAAEAAAGAALKEAPYARFRSIAAHLRPWVAEVEARACISSECFDVLSEAQQCYWGARHVLIQERLRALLEVQLQVTTGFGGGGGNAFANTAYEQLRYCCGVGLRTCAAEHALYSSCFSLSGAVGTRSQPTLHAQLESLIYPVYDVLRPLVLKQTALEPLCEMVLVLRDEVLADGSRASPACAPLESMFKRLLQDLQERILFRFQTFLRDEVRAFRPAPHEIDYPARLMADTTSGGSSNGGACYRAGWYPTLQRSLGCMARVYRCVPNGVFEGLAQEAVSDCTASLLRAAALLRGPRRQPLDAMLFEISHLLALRENITPFDVDLVATQKALDFSHSRTMLGALGARRRSVGAALAVVELLKHGAPSLIESHMDAKQHLEMHLKHACEAFILHCTDLAVQPLLPLLPQPAALKRGGNTAAKPSGGTAQLHVATPPKAEVLHAAFDAVGRAFVDDLARAHELTRRYLPEPTTQAILFSPIRANVLEALGQLQTMLNTPEMNVAQRLPLDVVGRLATLAARLEDITSGTTTPPGPPNTSRTD